MADGKQTEEENRKPEKYGLLESFSNQNILFIFCSKCQLYPDFENVIMNRI
jgi:hypothetical protein